METNLPVYGRRHQLISPITMLVIAFLFLHVMQRDLMDTGDMDLIQADGMVIGMGKRLSNTILYCPPGGGWLLIP